MCFRLFQLQPSPSHLRPLLLPSASAPILPQPNPAIGHHQHIVGHFQQNTGAVTVRSIRSLTQSAPWLGGTLHLGWHGHLGAGEKCGATLAQKRRSIQGSSSVAPMACVCAPSQKIYQKLRSFCLQNCSTRFKVQRFTPDAVDNLSAWQMACAKAPLQGHKF